jgi:GDP-D-mannose dehydratase
MSGSWTEVDDDPRTLKFYNNSERYENLVCTNEKFYRPAEVELLLGDPSEAKEKLGWEPEISFDKLVKTMVQFDIENCETKA